MSDPNDVALTKIVRREFNKRQLDTAMTDIRVAHGVVTLRGTIKTMRGSDIDARAEVEHIAKVLRTRGGIRDVVIDLAYRT